jgi:hypothetical protein
MHQAKEFINRSEAFNPVYGVFREAVQARR